MQEADERLEWTVWPAMKNPPAGAAVVALILAVSWYGYAGFGSLVYSLVALVGLTLSLTFFLFPSTYILDASGVAMRGFLHGRRRAWDELACYIRHRDVIAISVSPEPTERSISRGFLLRPAYNEDEVVAFVARHLPEWLPPVEGDAEGDKPGE